MMKNRFVKIGAVLVLFLLAIFLYSLLSGDKPAAEVSFERTTYATLAEQNEAEELLRQLRNIENLSLDGTLFAQPTFVRLVDFSQPLAPQDAGRNNPFAPLNPKEFRTAPAPVAEPE